MVCPVEGQVGLFCLVRVDYMSFERFHLWVYTHRPRRFNFTWWVVAILKIYMTVYVTCILKQTFQSPCKRKKKPE